MKKTIFLIPCLLIILAGVSAEDLKPRVLVLAPENKTSDAIYSGICTTVEELFSFTLGLLGEHDVLTAKDLSIPDNPDLSSLAEENSIDKILFGELTSRSDGSIVISMSLYEHNTDNVVASSQGTSYSLLEVFDVTDAILIELMKQFSDIYIGFGSLALINEGEEGAFQVFLDGRPVGDSRNLGALDKILNKDYLLEIRQKRFGYEHVIHSSKIVIEERKETVVAFAVPYLTPGEKADIDDLRSRTEKILADADSLDSDFKEVEQLENLLVSMGNLDFCPSLTDVRDSLQNLLNDFKDEMVLRDAIKNADTEGDRIPWSGYMNRLSSNDSTRQAYINMAEFVYVIKTVEAVKRWEDRSVLPGLDHYQNGYLPGYNGDSPFLQHAEQEQKYINSIYAAYYNDEVKNKSEVLSLIRKHYGKRLIGSLYNSNTTFFSMSKKKIRDFKIQIEALDTPEPVRLEKLKWYSIEPSFTFAGNGVDNDDNTSKSVGMFGINAGFGMILSENLSCAVDTGLLLTSYTVIDNDTGETVDERSPSVTAIPFGARIMYGNRRSGFAGGIGFNLFVDLPSAGNDILLPFMPELSLYYRNFFFTGFFWGGDNNLGGVGMKMGYVWR